MVGDGQRVSLSFAEQYNFQYINLLISVSFCFSKYTDMADMEDIVRSVRSDTRSLFFWTQFSAAQLCVDNRLRTPLGKPNDTICGLERLLASFTAAVDVDGKLTLDGMSCVLANQQNMRLQLEFLESLEKVVYNASEGTAFAMAKPERPSRIFFGVNASTCNEYFDRNRFKVNALGLYGMCADIVVRNAAIELRDMVASSRVFFVKYPAAGMIIIVWIFLFSRKIRDTSI